MAAYAALVSLMNTMDQIQIHPRLSTSFDNEQIQSLGETAGYLLDFIESYNFGVGSKEVEDLEAEIASAARVAEDAIESHIVDLVLAESTGQNGGLLQKMTRYIRKKPIHLPSVICDLRKAMEDMDSIKEDARKVEKQGRFKHERPHSASSRPIAPRKTTMVGFDDYLIHLLDRLTGQQSHQVVIPIIGMGGVGKTTLARNAFESLLIKQHFDVCAWATISQNHNVREILLQLLSSQEDSGNYTAMDDVHQLGEKLHKCLFYRRYLVILDDMWSIDVWDEISFYFPDNSNGSRIVVTTRLLDISHNFNSPYLTINLLDEDKSWNLFCQESFGGEGCPDELQNIGKYICENCKGLPLCIVVIGGLLRKSKALEYWEGVASDTYSALHLEGETQVMSILSLSYTHLLAHLKPCFLYMSVYEEDKEIHVSELIKLWVAEGFLRPNDGQSLEEVAEGYVKDLVDRNLILVSRWGSNGKIKTCKIHDLVRELCLSVAEKEKFICVTKLVSTHGAINRKRRRILTDHERISASLFCFLICQLPHRGFLKDYLRCVNLGFLDHVLLTDDLFDDVLVLSLHIPKNIYSLWSLQTLRLKGNSVEFIAPSELWEMVQLRHVQVNYLCVPDPPARNDGVDLVLSSLQTLRMVMNFQLSEEVCKRIPNVKKLGLVYSDLPQRCEACSYYCPQNLGRFHMLESLVLRFKGPNWRPMVLNVTFPSSLKKLTLLGGNLYWEDLRMIGSLPNLEVLKLESFSVIGSEWNPIEGEFLCLKILEIHCIELVTWNADYFHFPVLEKLDLDFLRKLDEIPSGIGEIPTLRIIQVSECSMSCALSAVKILEEQESLGNDDLQVVVELFTEELRDMFREELEQEGGFTSKNLHIKVHYPVFEHPLLDRY